VICEKFNVYTNPLKNPQRNPNVNPNRRSPLTEIEIQSIVIAHLQYSELGSWNLSLFLSNEFNVHVSAMSILRVLNPEKYKCKKIIEKIKFFEKPRSHVMYHADTMEVVFNNGTVVYQISIEDDYSRGYMAMCVFPMKHSYFVVLSMLQSFRLHSKPKLFHHDNGSRIENFFMIKISFKISKA